MTGPAQRYKRKVRWFELKPGDRFFLCSWGRTKPGRLVVERVEDTEVLGERAVFYFRAAGPKRVRKRIVSAFDAEVVHRQDPKDADLARRVEAMINGPSEDLC